MTDLGDGYLKDDTGKGLDLKDWSTANIGITEHDGGRSLSLKPGTAITLPNHILIARNLKVDVDFIVIAPAPAFLIASPQLDLFIDADGYLNAQRTTYDFTKQKDHPVAIRSSDIIPANQSTTCSVIITHDTLSLFINGQQQRIKPIAFPLRNDEATIRMGVAIKKNMLPQSQQDSYPIPFAIDVNSLTVKALPPK